MPSFKREPEMISPFEEPHNGQDFFSGSSRGATFWQLKQLKNMAMLLVDLPNVGANRRAKVERSAAFARVERFVSAAAYAAE